MMNANNRYDGWSILTGFEADNKRLQDSIGNQYDAAKSVRKYARMCLQAIEAAYPGADIDVWYWPHTDGFPVRQTTVIDRQRAEHADVERDVDALCQLVLESREWLVAPDEPMTMQDWADLINEHKDEVADACRDACRESLLTTTYHAVRLDERGNVTINEYDSADDEPTDEHSITLAVYPPDDWMSFVDPYAIIPEYLYEDEMDDFHDWCQAHDADAIFETLLAYDEQLYQRVCNEIADDWANANAPDWVFKPLNDTLDKLVAAGVRIAPRLANYATMRLGWHAVTPGQPRRAVQK